MLHIERFVCNPFQENCYIVHDETLEAVIIDCGAFYEEERTAIVKYIKDNKLTLKHLIATHAHIDHNFGNNTIFSEFAVRPEVALSDKTLMTKLAVQAQEFCNYKLNYELPDAGRFFTANDNITFGSHTLRVIATPGHTPGSVFFYCKEEKVAFSGDTLFKQSIGRTDFELGSNNDIMSSLQHIAHSLPGDTVILPGHGPKTTISNELKSNPFMR